MEERKPPRRSLTYTALKTLDRLSGHTSATRLHRRKTGLVPSAPTHGRVTSSYQPPPPLLPNLPPRSRCLTPPPFEISEQEPAVLHDQIQSPLLNLPEDVLMMIYERIIGNRVLHIVRRSHKLGHTSCKSMTRDPDACTDAKCRGLKSPTGLYVLAGPGSGGLIQLLQSCRKVYTNAIKTLYSSNIFDFDSLESLISTSCATLPQRFDSIQNVQLDLRFSLSHYFQESTPGNDTPRWLRTWAVIGSVKSLQNLWVRIAWWRPRIGATEEKDLMEPLWMVHRLKIYEVSLPPAWQGNDVDWSDAPFKVTRRQS